MSSPSKDADDEVSSSADGVSNGVGGGGEASAEEAPRPPAKRPAPAVIEISDTDSDDSDICAVTSYQASADEVKRIRGADYSSSSSSSSYSSDSEPGEDDSVVLSEQWKMKGAVARPQLLPRAARNDDPIFNPKYKSQEVIDRISSSWRELKDWHSSEASVTCDPFRLCLLHELLANPEIINNIVDDMNTLDWSRKKMDLYEFHQTADLASLTWQRSIRGIYELLKTDVMSWVSRATGLQLARVSASCSLYGPGDHLLVHDDRLADRRVAFILYLAPWSPRPAPPPPPRLGPDTDDTRQTETIEVCSSTGWAEHMGGALELLSRDEAGQPGGVARRVLPSNNMLAFFKVGHDSYHQVSEVLSLELPRLSINGWFHGPAAEGEGEEDGEGEGDELVAPPPPDMPLRFHNDVVLVQEWISTAYMSPRARAAVQTQMERDSEVALHDFLQPGKYRALLEALDDPAVHWETAGPSNQRLYDRLPSPPAGPLAEFVQLLRSAAFARVLLDCTDLPLTAHCRLEVQRWRQTHFTLLPPRSVYGTARLEALYHLGAPTRAISGGSTSFVAPEDASAAPGGGALAGGALVTVPPVSNALSLVYCDAGAAGFTKYLSKITMPPHERFYVVTCTYTE